MVGFQIPTVFLFFPTLGTSVILGESDPLRVILLPNPSHLEAANPVNIPLVDSCSWGVVV